MAVQKYGSQCLNLVTRATQCLSVNPEEAQQILADIKETTPLLLQQLQKRREDIAAKRDELDEMDKALKREIGAKETEKKNLSYNMKRSQEKKARNEALLQDARNDLSRAQDNKSRAESKKDGAIAGTVAGGVGAAILGVVFPPSLAVTIPAVAAVGTVSIVEADKEVDRCRDRIGVIQRDIDSEREKIRRAESEISGIQREISALNSKQRSLHERLTPIREAFVFLQKAVTFFNDLHVAVGAGEQKTDLLHTIAKKANEKKEYKILNSRGGITIANSFADAWEQVEEKLLSGDEKGYTAITILDRITN